MNAEVKKRPIGTLFLLLLLTLLPPEARRREWRVVGVLWDDVQQF